MAQLAAFIQALALLPGSAHCFAAQGSGFMTEYTVVTLCSGYTLMFAKCLTKLLLEFTTLPWKGELKLILKNLQNYEEINQHSL